jgi:hypothetical protein
MQNPHNDVTNNMVHLERDGHSTYRFRVLRPYETGHAYSAILAHGVVILISPSAIYAAYLLLIHSSLQQHIAFPSLSLLHTASYKFALKHSNMQASSSIFPIRIRLQAEFAVVQE